jgi:hypothetical protein
MNIIPAGIDRAKSVFAVHGVNDSGKPATMERGFTNYIQIYQCKA